MPSFFLYFVFVSSANAAKVEFIVYVGQLLVRKSKEKCKNFPQCARAEMLTTSFYK